VQGALNDMKCAVERSPLADRQKMELECGQAHARAADAADRLESARRTRCDHRIDRQTDRQAGWTGRQTGICTKSAGARARDGFAITENNRIHLVLFGMQK
jgi:hypothetical protein